MLKKVIDETQKCSRILDDIDTITEAVIERDMTPDQIANLLIGLKELYSIRFANLSDAIELETQNGST